jgi:hypothetical protein
MNFRCYSCRRSFDAPASKTLLCPDCQVVRATREGEGTQGRVALRRVVATVQPKRLVWWQWAVHHYPGKDLRMEFDGMTPTSQPDTAIALSIAPSQERPASVRASARVYLRQKSVDAFDWGKLRGSHVAPPCGVVRGRREGCTSTGPAHFSTALR